MSKQKIEKQIREACPSDCKVEFKHNEGNPQLFSYRYRREGDTVYSANCNFYASRWEAKEGWVIKLAESGGER